MIAYVHFKSIVKMFILFINAIKLLRIPPHNINESPLYVLNAYILALERVSN